MSQDPDPTREPLRLDQFLKMSGLTNTGGQAKVMIQAGDVMVNGEIELRRRRKLALGDIVEIDGHQVSVDEYLIDDEPGLFED
ncbi:RNA-binding S4 domain-containing protein [Planctomicrobium sp. SH668]|uniref:RNA-binding S4 domain-containing protein n=1 Tax=Planctomicrobium sp. SH668 TaxID=3448126 RepID=UPI003F5C6065